MGSNPDVVVVMVLGLVVIVLRVFLVDGLIIVEALASVAPNCGGVTCTPYCVVK